MAKVLRRGSVAQDHRHDRPGVFRRVEQFRHGIEGVALPDPDTTARIDQKIPPPGCLWRPSGDADHARWTGVVLDVTDRDRTRLTGPPTAGLDPREPAGCDKSRLHRAGRVQVGDGQRARCQDLPSVWVDGA